MYYEGSWVLINSMNVKKYPIVVVENYFFLVVSRNKTLLARLNFGPRRN